jgi:regulator of protease activity HflC (stomatin/prohibitin superfamily)
LAKYITKHYLDELLVFETPDLNSSVGRTASTTPKAGQLLSWQERERLRQGMDNFLRSVRGITLTDLRIVDFELPPEVNQQRLQVLDAETKSRVKRMEGNAAAEQTRVSGEMHAQAQQELIGMIADGLNKIDPANFADSVLLSLSSILSQSLEDPMTSAVTARDTLAVLEQLRDFLNKKET